MLSDRIRANGVPTFLLSRATGFKAHDFDKTGSPGKDKDKGAAKGQGQEGEETAGGGGGGGTGAGAGAVSGAGAGKESKSIVDFGSQAKQDQLAELVLISSTTVKVQCHDISCHTTIPHTYSIHPITHPITHPTLSTHLIHHRQGAVHNISYHIISYHNIPYHAI